LAYKRRFPPTQVQVPTYVAAYQKKGDLLRYRGTCPLCTGSPPARGKQYCSQHRKTKDERRAAKRVNHSKWREKNRERHRADSLHRYYEKTYGPWAKVKIEHVNLLRARRERKKKGE